MKKLVKCGKCGLFKEHKAKNLCLKCYRKQYNKQYHKSDKYKQYIQSDKYKEYRKKYNQSDKHKEYIKKYRIKNKVKLAKQTKQYMKQYNLKNKEKIKERQKQYQIKHKEHLTKMKKEYLSTENGKLTSKKKDAKRKRNLGFCTIDIIPLDVWKFIDIDKLNYHHLNNLLVTPIPYHLHKNNFGNNHRNLINIWFSKININIIDIITGGIDK